MKKIAVVVAAVGLAGGFAAAQGQEAQDTQDFDPAADIATETPSPSDRYNPGRDIVTDENRNPNMTMGEQQTDTPITTDYGLESTANDDFGAGAGGDENLSGANASELEGRTVLTLDGEEVGQIRRVGTNPEDGTRVATIDAGGFLGVGNRTIAVPLTRLSRSAADGQYVRLGMMRTSLEAEPAFDESRLEPDG